MVKRLCISLGARAAPNICYLRAATFAADCRGGGSQRKHNGAIGPICPIGSGTHRTHRVNGPIGPRAHLGLQPMRSGITTNAQYHFLASELGRGCSRYQHACNPLPSPQAVKPTTLQLALNVCKPLAESWTHPRPQEPGFQIKDPGCRPRTPDPVSRTRDPGSKSEIKVPGSRILGPGLGGPGSELLDPEVCCM